MDVTLHDYILYGDKMTSSDNLLGCGKFNVAAGTDRNRPCGFPVELKIPSMAAVIDRITYECLQGVTITTQRCLKGYVRLPRCTLCALIGRRSALLHASGWRNDGAPEKRPIICRCKSKDCRRVIIRNGEFSVPRRLTVGSITTAAKGS